METVDIPKGEEFQLSENLCTDDHIREKDNSLCFTPKSSKSPSVVKTQNRTCHPKILTFDFKILPLNPLHAQHQKHVSYTITSPSFTIPKTSQWTALANLTQIGLKLIQNI